MLKGKVALVTGASRGIGRAVALEMARQGADVAVCYAGNADKAEETCQLARAYGVRSARYACDVADRTAVQAMVKAALTDFGKVDILVNNAGITRDALLPQMGAEDLDRVLDVNLKGAFHTIQALYRTFLRQRSGRIINLSSVSGLMGNAGQANYAAAKAGLIGLTKSVARELASRGVTCNAVAPGYIQTDMTAALPEAAQAAFPSRIPLGRLGVPEDVAPLCAFLASEGAGYITGAVICVDGGLNM